MTDKAVVLFSGGQDSTTCLAWAVKHYGKDFVFPISFDYGQKHSIERDQAKIIAGKMGLREPLTLPVEVLSLLGGAALTDTSIDVEAEASKTSGNTWAAKHNLPSTFVPGRNLLFLSIAAAYAAKVGANTLVTGICEADDAGYPDCRSTFALAMQVAIEEALGDTFYIEAPLLFLDKARTFALAADLGVLDLVIEDSHTCYHGDRSQKFDWGYGCGVCPACVTRKDGWAVFVDRNVSV